MTTKLLPRRFVQSAGDSPAHKELDTTAEIALRSCRYPPGRDATGQPEPETYRVSFKWVLN